MNLPSKKHGFTLIELLVVISIIGILASLAIPAVGNALTRGQMTQTLSNARQLQIATQTMSMDTTTSGSGWAWTQPSGAGGASNIQNFSNALITDNYLTTSELNKIYAAPGVPRESTNASFSADTIAFKIFQVEENSPSDQPFVVTKNWDGATLVASAAPYGDKGFVVFRKGGDGQILTRGSDAEALNNEFGTSDGSSRLTKTTLQ